MLMQKKYAPKRNIKVAIDPSAYESLIENFTEESCTIVHCCSTGKKMYENGGWVNINRATFLEKSGGKSEGLSLLHAINIPLAPEKHYFKKHGDSIRFTLYFPAIPKDWTSFSLIEKSEQGNAFRAHNLTQNHTGIYVVFF